MGFLTGTGVTFSRGSWGDIFMLQRHGRGGTGFLNRAAAPAHRRPSVGTLPDRAFTAPRLALATDSSRSQPIERGKSAASRVRLLRLEWCRAYTTGSRRPRP
jgi:hypothetical protein